jgi:excisionase family DNA binding protein
MRTETIETDARLNYSVPDLARRLGIGIESMYGAIKRNEVPHLKIGRRIILPKAAIQEWLKSPATGRVA